MAIKPLSKKEKARLAFLNKRLRAICKEKVKLEKEFKILKYRANIYFLFKEITKRK